MGKLETSVRQREKWKWCRRNRGGSKKIQLYMKITPKGQCGIKMHNRNFIKLHRLIMIGFFVYTR